MDGVVRLFTESSFDRLFVISGIVLLLLAAIGSVSGKFELGKGGRIFAGLCGAVFVIGGLLMHSFHSFRLVSADILTRPIAYQGGCPMDVPIQGRIDAQGSGKVLYAIEYSGSPANRAATITFDESSPFQVVDATWKITESVDNG